MSRSERKESSHLIRPLADDAEDVWMSTLREFQSATTSGNQSKITGVATTCDATGAANKLSSAQKSTEAGAFERIANLTCSSDSLSGEGRDQNSRRSKGNEEIVRIHFPATRAIGASADAIQLDGRENQPMLIADTGVLGGDADIGGAKSTVAVPDGADIGAEIPGGGGRAADTSGDGAGSKEVIGGNELPAEEERSGGTDRGAAAKPLTSKIRSFFSKRSSSAPRLHEEIGSNFDVCAASTPKITQVNGKNVRNRKDLFTLTNHFGYILRDFLNRKSFFIPYGGFRDNDKNMVKFDNEADEKLNFLYSKLGDIASIIDQNSEYFIYGIRSYVRVNKCANCRKNKKCDEDHHLQCLLNDIELNKDMERELTTRDVDVRRSFETVSLNQPPIFNRLSDSLENILDPNLLTFPLESVAKTLYLEKMVLDETQFENLNKNHFPLGEIRGNPKKGFLFNLYDKTPKSSVIVNICMVINYSKKDILQGLEYLMASGEPKEICVDSCMIQTTKHSIYALYCLYLDFKLKTSKDLDELFNFKDLNVKAFHGNEFGKVRAGLIPLGLIFTMLRLHVEAQINAALTSLMNSFNEQNLPELIIINHQIFVKNNISGGKLVVVNHPSFAPINNEMNSPLSEFLSNMYKVLKTLKTNDLEEMGLQTDFFEILTKSIERLETDFLKLRNFEFNNELDSAERIVLQMFNGTDISQAVNLIVVPEPEKFKIFEDNRDVRTNERIPDFPSRVQNSP